MRVACLIVSGVCLYAFMDSAVHGSSGWATAFFCVAAWNVYNAFHV